MAKSKDTSTELSIKRTSVLAPVESEGALSVPDFMRASGPPEGTEDMDKFVTPPRVKVVQKSANPPYSDMFNTGDVVLTPQMLLVAPVKLNDSGKPTDAGTPFAICPLLFFVEWTIQSPLVYKDQEPFIIERTRDPNSEIARKAKSPETWSEPHPTRPEHEGKPVNIRYVESLNFVALIASVSGLEGLPVVFSFSKTAHRSGSNLATLIKLRRAPIYGCIFELATFRRENAQGSWYNLAVSNPKETGFGPFVTDAAEYERLKQMHLDLKDKVVVNYDDYRDEVDPDAGVDVENSAF